MDRTREELDAARVELIAMAIGSIGFAFWMQSAGAGWWCFVTYLVVSDSISTIAKAIRGTE